MIKLIREGSRKYPWILLSIVGGIVVTFVIGMGWWGYGDDVQGSQVATVGDFQVSLDEYKRAYQNLSAFYQENKQDVTDEQIRRRALDQLVSTRIWILAAQEMGLTITPEELRASILSIKDFQQSGRFDPELYRRLLAFNRLTPALFETLQRRELLAEKARTMVAESVALTPSEIADAEALAAGVTSQAGSSPMLSKDFLVQNFLFQKQQRAVQAYLESLKRSIPVKINERNL